MTEKRESVASWRVIIAGYAAEIETTGTLEEFVACAAKMRALGIEPGNSPLLWERQAAPAGERPPSRDETHPVRDAHAPLCPIHERHMLKSKHHEGFYCPERLGDGEFCKQRAS